MERKSFNEVLKEREAQERLQRAARSDEHIALDDSQRVKVLSPGRMVFKRFIRNKLAIVGSAILIFMFLFAFVGAIIYPYGQTDRFYKYEYMQGDYAGAQKRTEYTNYVVNNADVSDDVGRRVNSAILTLKGNEDEASVFHVDAGSYAVVRNEDTNIFTVSECTEDLFATFHTQIRIGTIDKLKAEIAYEADVEDLGDAFYSAAAAAMGEKAETFAFGGKNYELKYQNKNLADVYEISDMAFTYTGESLGADFEQAVLDVFEMKKDVAAFGGKYYHLVEEDGLVSVYLCTPADVVMVSTTYVFNTAQTGRTLSNDFKGTAILAMTEDGAFTADGEDYTIAEGAKHPEILNSAGDMFAELSTFVVRGVDGKDTFDIPFKEAVEEAVVAMEERGDKVTTMTYPLLQRVNEYRTDENGDIVNDDDGKPIEILVTVTDENGNPVYEDTTITIKKMVNDYELTCPMLLHLFDINAMPSGAHIFGTDSDGYDVLARMMYGGRVSLMVGFVVVIIETVLGTIMGGISGYFGGWVDNLIMRLVDIFYCIPSMPILIIMGAFMDHLHLPPEYRIWWMMFILGVLGWAGIARLVRGQILSLREQEFMVATEATGVKVSRRIFRHLVPNVMPQLIVSATAGLGGVILTESTLSFLGLGVKHPMATWGTMINSVTQRNEDMIKYTYIWIPVGLLICLTVIAFNFVGDGLRDAFDPKMKK